MATRAVLHGKHTMMGREAVVRFAGWHRGRHTAFESVGSGDSALDVAEHREERLFRPSDLGIEISWLASPNETARLEKYCRDEHRICYSQLMKGTRIVLVHFSGLFETIHELSARCRLQVLMKRKCCGKLEIVAEKLTRLVYKVWMMFFGETQ